MAKRKTKSKRLAKNLQALKKFSPNLYEALPQIESTGKYRVHDQKILMKMQDKEVELRGMPQGEFKLCDFAKFFIVVGIGSGSEVLNTIHQAQKNGSSVILIEPDLEIFSLALECHDFTGLMSDRNSFLLLGMSPNSVFARLAEIFGRNEYCEYVSTIQALDSQSLIVRSEERSLEMFKGIKQAQLNTMDSYGYEADSWAGIQLCLENLPDMIDDAGVCNLTRACPNIPAFIISAGPSLQEALPYLKSFIDKGIIISTDGAFSVLVDHGITPDFVTSIERGLYSKPLFDRASNCTDTTLIRFPFVPSLVFENFKGRRMIAYRSYEYFRYFYPPKGRVECGASVSHFSAKLALIMQCSPIILVGQDLCFHPETFQSHCEGVPHGNPPTTAEKILQERDASWIEGNTYKKVLTLRQWGRFIHDFQLLLNDIQTPMINTARLGAIIPGTYYQELEKLDSHLKKLDLTKTRSALKAAARPKRDAKAHTIMQERIDRWVEFFNMLLSYRSYIDPLVDDEQITLDQLAELDELAIQMRQTPMFSCFLLAILGGEHIKCRNDLHALGKKITEKTREQARRIHRLWFKSVFRNCDRLADLLVEIRSELAV